MWGLEGEGLEKSKDALCCKTGKGKNNHLLRAAENECPAEEADFISGESVKETHRNEVEDVEHLMMIDCEFQRTQGKGFECWGRIGVGSD